MKTKLLVIAFLILGIVGNGQKLIDEKKVPENVQRTFKKKAARATDVKWFQEGKEFTAKYSMNNLPAEISIGTDGTINMMKSAVEYKKLPTSIQKDLSENHKDKRFSEANLIVMGKKEKYYSIILHKKQGRKEPVLVYEAQYTMQGKLITVFEPVVKEEVEKTAEPTKFDKNVDKDIDKIKEKVANEKVNRKDLPSRIEEYLSANFDYEYKAKIIETRTNDKYGQYYYIVMKKQGEKKKFIHYFDLEGNLLESSEEAL